MLMIQKKKKNPRVHKRIHNEKSISLWSSQLWLWEKNSYQFPCVLAEISYTVTSKCKHPWIFLPLCFLKRYKLYT